MPKYPETPREMTEEELEASYREMAADKEAEREAYEWIEGLIGDVADDPSEFKKCEVYDVTL